jgi:YesN/AraC family two-component response regulator
MEAENGIMGITKAKELIPDLIITDVMMPGMNGYEVCHELTHDALTSHIPVLMLTAKSAQEDKLEGYTAGADAYITKPFKSRELLLRTQMLIERRKSLQKRYQLLGSNHEKIPHRNETESKFVQTILDTLQTQIAEPGLDVSSLADAVNMSERQLRRKFKAVFGQSPNQYIRTFRLKKALELLRSHAGNVSEVCYQVGFNNVSYFSKCFREEIGVSPSDVV